MAFVHYTEASGGLPNSGRLSGTNGDLVGILDVVLVAAGWAIEYTSGNARVYRPATGNRFRLHVNDDSAVSGNAGFAVVRGCENASAAATLIDPFPQVAQIADGSCNWIKSSAANTTARNFDIYASDTWVFYAVNFSGTSNFWEWHFFGDIPAIYSGDTYNTVCCVRNTVSTASTNMYPCCSSVNAGSQRIFWARCYDGTVKSTQGAVFGGFPAIGSNSSNFATPQNGPSGKVDIEKIVLSDTGSQTTALTAAKALSRRGVMPNLWNPQHGGFGALNVRDTWTDTVYNGSAVFSEVSTTVNSAFIVIETTNTWSPPSI